MLQILGENGTSYLAWSVALDNYFIHGTIGGPYFGAGGC